MNSIKQPFVSVITVNWNGKHFLKDWLPSIVQLNYPTYEIIVVDNASTDGSVEFIKQKYPQVTVIENKENRAFAGGNNDGIRYAVNKVKSKYIALINNDTRVDENWLDELVKTAESDNTIGAVGSKILFYKPFIRLRITTQTFKPETDPRELGVGLWNVPKFKSVNYSKRIWGKGFYPQEYYGEDELRWTQSDATISVPVDSIANFTLQISLQGHKPEQQIDFFIGEKKIKTLKITDYRKDYEFPVDKELINQNKHEIIQNAGSVFDTQKFEGGDRGMYEIDEGQYDKQEEVGNLCGASMLIPVEVLKNSGLFDEYFFMYYEDTDLCQRIKKTGYKLIYNPKSIVHHIHTGSSKEWSPFFIYQVERNRIANALKNAEVKVILYLGVRIKKIWLKHFLKFIRKPTDSQNTTKFKVYTKVLLNLSINWPQLILKRFNILKCK